jgi:hypothetical protein
MGKRHKYTYGHPEPDPIPGKRFIEVGDGHFVWVDEADYDLVKVYRWSLDKKGEPVAGMADEHGRQTTMRMKAMLLNYRTKKGHCVKYLDGNTFNNSRDNIKIMTLKEARALDREILGPPPPRTWKVKNHVKRILNFEDDASASPRKETVRRIWEGEEIPIIDDD